MGFDSRTLLHEKWPPVRVAFLFQETIVKTAHISLANNREILYYITNKPVFCGKGLKIK